MWEGLQQKVSTQRPSEAPHRLGPAAPVRLYHGQPSKQNSSIEGETLMKNTEGTWGIVLKCKLNSKKLKRKGYHKNILKISIHMYFIHVSPDPIVNRYTQLYFYELS